MDVKTLCLGALQLGDASGYEIKKMFEDGLFSHIHHQTSFGAIYPALSRLEREGLAVGTAMAQDKRPDKKVYSITDAGRAALVRALLQPPSPDKYRSDYLFIMIFGDLLPPAQLEALVGQRIEWHRKLLSFIDSCDLTRASPGFRVVCGEGAAIHRAALDFLEGNRAVLKAGRPDAANGATAAAAPAEQVSP